jgi:hypothetical protein
MSEHILKTIEHVREEIAKAEEALRPKKALVNQLCELAGVPLMYELGDSATAPLRVIRRNAFYGKPLSTCVREFLEMRTTLPVREATLDDIFSALKEGGYDLKASGDKEEDQKRGVAIAIGKNSQTFHRLPTGDYGLISWYPNIRERKGKQENGGKEEKPSDKTAASEVGPDEKREPVHNDQARV